MSLCYAVHFLPDCADLPGTGLQHQELGQHPRRPFRLPHQHDLPECVRSSQRNPVENFITIYIFKKKFLASQVITSELPIFLREHFNGMYRTDVYFLCKTMADFPIYVVFPFIFITIPYFAIGLNPDVERYFTAAGIVILVANVATSFGTILTLVWLSTSYLC